MLVTGAGMIDIEEKIKMYLCVKCHTSQLLGDSIFNLGYIYLNKNISSF